MTRAAQGVLATRTRARRKPPPLKAMAGLKGLSTRLSARALANMGHMATPAAMTVWVSMLNSLLARPYSARAWDCPRWDRRSWSVWKAIGMARDCSSWGPAVLTMRTPRTLRSRGTSLRASLNRGRVARQATTMQMTDTRALAM